MNITATRVRLIRNSNIFAIASVTLDDELIINDIRVVKEISNIKLIFPCTERATLRKQYNIVPSAELYNKIKKSIFHQIDKNGGLI